MPKPSTRAAAPPRTAGGDQARTRLVRAIRAACGRLGIDDDERRALQQDLVGKASLTAMSIGELGRVLDQLNRDWNGPMAHRPHLGKIKALWWSLYWLGEVDGTDDRAISAFVKRQTGISSLRFLAHDRAPAVIEALKSWLERAGVEWPAPGLQARGLSSTPGSTTARAERLAVLEAIGQRIEDANLLPNGWLLHLHRENGLSGNSRYWNEAELDAAIRCLGLLWRELRS